MTTAGAGPAAAAPAIRTGRSGSRLPYRRNPLRLAFSGSPWRGAWYLAGYVFVAGWLLCAAALLSAGTAALLAVTLAGIPLLTAAAGVLRGCASVERRRLRQVLTEPVRGHYEPEDGMGIVARAKTRWQDRATWRDLGYLIGLWIPLLALDTVVLASWLVLLAGITMPVWYWAPTGTGIAGYSSGPPVHGVVIGYFPHGPHGPGGAGLFIDSLPRALLAAAISAILFLLFNYVLVATARTHASVARALLRAPADPLAEARDVLARPGPIPPPRSAPSAGDRDRVGGGITTGH